MTQPDHYAVLGNPVAHSRSPFIHARFAQQTGEPVSYDRLHCGLDGFEAAVRKFAAAGGRGCNVTLPFKFDALRLAARCSERAALAGAANVLRFDSLEDGGWFADNTDGIGLVNDIQHNANLALAGKRLLLVGAGGAGAGVLGPLLAQRPATLVLVNRSNDKALALVASHADWARRHGAVLTAAPLAAPGSGFDVLINASSSSLQGAASPVPLQVLAPGALAVDLMYGPAAAAFVTWAQAAGVVARDGLGMLVEQAAEAFYVWRGIRPATTPVLQALREEVSA